MTGPASEPTAGRCSWENEARSRGAGNTARPLTHSLDSTKEGMAVKATRKPISPADFTSHDGQRFWAKVDKTPTCWNWTGSVSMRDGYGNFQTTVDGKAVPWKAHRVAAVLTGWTLNPALVLDHICRNRACVNPDHLREISNRANILAGISFSAVNARKTHCIAGHELTPENTYVRPRRPTERECRICRQRRALETVERRKAAKSMRTVGSLTADDLGATVTLRNGWSGPLTLVLHINGHTSLTVAGNDIGTSSDALCEVTR